MNIELARHNMIEQQVRPWDVLDDKILTVLQEVPREAFVPEDQQGAAFADVEIPLGHGECMLSPKVEGRMMQALDIQPSDVILEIGTGSGFTAACMAKLGSRVYSIELYEEFKHSAKKAIEAQDITNTELWTGDAASGWDFGPNQYDAIAVTGAIPGDVSRFTSRLTMGGRLFVVRGQEPAMQAELITRVGDKEFTTEVLFETSLKPLVGFEAKPAFKF